MLGGAQRAAAQGSLDDDGAPAEGGDQPVADQEARPGRRLVGRALADQDAAGGDLTEQLAVPLGVTEADPAGQHGHGPAASDKRAAVSTGIDPVSAPRDDRPA